MITEVSQKCGVEEGEIHTALLSEDSENPLVIAYNLVVDSKRIESAKAEEYKEFFGPMGEKMIIVIFLDSDSMHKIEVFLII